MQGRESPLAKAVVEYPADELERLVGVAQAVTMSHEEYLAVDLCSQRLVVQDDAALFFQILLGPDVVVAGEVMYLDAHIGQLRQFAEEAGVAFGHHVTVFIPEVEHVAEQIDGGRLLLNTVEEAHQPALLHPAVFNSPRTEVSITEKIYIFHK